MSGALSQTAEMVAAIFPDRSAAEGAQAALIAAGVGSDQIRLVSQPPAPDGAARSRSIWAQIREAFLDHHHAHIFAEGVERGRCVLFVRAEAGSEAARVTEIVQVAHPLDVTHHLAEWRRSGWSGRHAGEEDAPIPLLFPEHEDLDHIPTTGMINETSSVRPIGAPLRNPMGIAVSGTRQVLRYAPLFGPD